MWRLMRVTLAIGMSLWLGSTPCRADLQGTRQQMRADRRCAMLGRHHRASVTILGCVEVAPGVWVSASYFQAGD